jgi:hypothetical protein
MSATEAMQLLMQCEITYFSGQPHRYDIPFINRDWTDVPGIDACNFS